MSHITTLPVTTASGDKDLVEQAVPGHGVPSQDPDPAAQVMLDPEEAEREAKSMMAGGGAVGGAVIGATIGVAVGGPVGVVVGGTIGAVAGALGGAAAGELMNPADPEMPERSGEGPVPAHEARHAIESLATP